jgi:hypothetical protein
MDMATELLHFFGPKNVIVIAGINKVEPNLDAAILRVKSYAAPMTMLIFEQDYAFLMNFPKNVIYYVK